MLFKYVKYKKFFYKIVIIFKNVINLTCILPTNIILGNSLSSSMLRFACILIVSSDTDCMFLGK